MTNEGLTTRQKNILDFVIKEFINSAKPVPSAVVSKRAHLDVSPATIRSELSHLEDRGYLSQLHTSGARVPTDKAYRHFVNGVINEPDIKVSQKEQKEITGALARAGSDPRAINKSIADVLSGLSDNVVITGIDNQSDFFKSGLRGLFSMPEFQELDRVFEFASFFDEFDNIFSRLEREFLGHGGSSKNVNIIIGRENPMSKGRGETVMIAKYNLPHGFIGSLTLIGPTRMDYERNISLIKYTTGEVKKSINKK